MKFLVLSDLHIESGAYKPVPNVDHDALILAGDIKPAGGSLPDWAARTFGHDRPIIIVPGNHEFYGTVMEDERLRMRAHLNANVHVLDPGEVRLDNGRVRVLGCTLWTDFALPIRVSPQGAATPTFRSDVGQAMREARLALADYSCIAVEGEGGTAPTDREGATGDPDAEDLPPPRALRRLTPEDTLRLHLEQRDWLLARLQEPFTGTTVVVTHHAPCRQSVAERWASDWVSAGFASELPGAFFEVPALWVHGHTHASFDYVHGRTRVVCNPRGYPMRDGSLENARFDPAFVVEVADPAGSRGKWP